MNRGSGSKQSFEDQEETNKSKDRGVDSRGGFRGFKGRFGGGRGSNSFSGRCYNCNQFGHPTFKCSDCCDLITHHPIPDRDPPTF